MSVALLLAAAVGAFAASSSSSSSYPSPTSPRPTFSTVEPTLAAIQSAQATGVPSSPTSNVKGIAFDRIIQIWLENTDYNASAADPNLQWFASQGILLTNYFAVTHPSEPNYVASVGGDHFGIDNDDFLRIPSNVSTVVDLLDTKGISWGEYQEDLPYPGFQGFNYSNQKTYANDYVRKHDPLIIFDSVANNATRAAQIKNFTSFYDDLSAQKLPQWAFITPNMTNDAHDTNVTFAAQWARNFLGPLLNNTYFTNNTLIILTFDETETYTEQNVIYTVLLGGAIPSNLKGTTDSMFYNHYSTIATVSQNWGLPSLGRWDCNANVLALVANKTNYANNNVSTQGLYFNASYPGPLSDKLYTPGWWPAPNTAGKCAAGTVLDAVKSAWGGNSTGSYNYTNVYPYDAASNTNVGPNAAGGNSSSSSGGSGTSSGGSSSTSSSTSSTSSPTSTGGSSGAGYARPDIMAVLGLAGMAAAFL